MRLSVPVTTTTVAMTTTVCLYSVHLFCSISPMLVMILLMAFVFWIHRLCKSVWRFIKFWEIRSFFTEVLNIAPVSAHVMCGLTRTPGTLILFLCV